MWLGGLGERLSFPSGSGWSSAAKRFLVHFQPIWRHFLQIFSCSLSFVKLLFHVASDVKYHIVVISTFGHCIKFLWLGARGPQELGGPGSLNRLNPRYLRHWSHAQNQNSSLDRGQICERVSLMDGVLVARRKTISYTKRHDICA